MVKFEVTQGGQPIPIIQTRLVVQSSENGATMQVYISGRWIGICTLREDGTLGLHDIYTKTLIDAGFRMDGIHEDEQSETTIRTHIQ